jgi:hypothetical protein
LHDSFNIQIDVPASTLRLPFFATYFPLGKMKDTDEDDRTKTERFFATVFSRQKSG